MRKLTWCLMAVLLIAAISARAGEQNWLVAGHVTTGTVSTTANCPMFDGYIDELICYAPANVTGTVAIVMVDPVKATEWVLATNAAVLTAHYWRPRVMAPANFEGSTSLTVTNSGDRIPVHGETIKARISTGGHTNQTLMFKVKYSVEP